MAPKPEDPSPSPPIPTYEEAISLFPPEHQTLLGDDCVPNSSSSRQRNGYYIPPSVQSARSSEDSTAYRFRRNSSDSDADSDSPPPERLRRDVEEFDYLNPGELEEGSSGQRESGWKGRLQGFKRRMGRWRKGWWKPSFMEGWGLGQGSGYRWIPSMTVPQQYRPGCSLIARLCGLFIVITLGYALFVLEIMPNGRSAMGQMFDPEGVREFAQSSVNGTRIQEYLELLAGVDHMAGTKGNYYLAKHVANAFTNAGMDNVQTEQLYGYLNYPKLGGRKVAIVEPADLAWEAKLEEEPVYPSPNPGQYNTAPFHAHSRAGNVQGPLVYANYGTREDFKRLYDSGININGSIALVRALGPQQFVGLKIKAAEEWGVIGLLSYSDPADDGFKRGEAWPKGRWRPEDSVMRGDASIASFIMGDPLTPGFMTEKNGRLISKDDNPGLPNIPSLPLAWRDAKRLLQVLEGHGQEVPEEWAGGVPDVPHWWTGDQTSPIINLINEQDEEPKQRLFNVIGTINGLETKSQKVIIGAPRDAFCFGASSSAASTATLLELVAVVGKLRAQGWRPLRTIIFASWDASAYNNIGATEWVEANLARLRADAVAYINVGSGVTGPAFHAKGSPMLVRPLLRALSRVADPAEGANGTLRDAWDARGGAMPGLGAGTDASPFAFEVGAASLDMGFGDPADAAMLNSCYDTLEWGARFGDAGRGVLEALTRVWVLLTLELSQELLLPMDAGFWAGWVAEWAAGLQSYAEKKGAPWGGEGKKGFELDRLMKSARELVDTSRVFHMWDDWWYGQVYGRGGMETNGVALQRMGRNERLAGLEKAIIPGLEQFANLLSAPEPWDPATPASFPVVREAIDRGDWDAAQKAADHVADVIEEARKALYI
ncbi:Zn-dependent exopeptidase [Trichodelitschia bisporula]|uniref:Zn-dependent exopeptidase n=1 Tax=Trichodelitschia bisporula TaxID=703511 RepID=A0A6G1HK22_9PEZI|nr:Zn-dependent exopeptidase [Trichodelitschia bisporula]